MAVTFRSLYKWLVPRWLNSGEGERILFSLSMLLDAFSERMLQARNVRAPTLTGPSALALIGRDRGILQGRSETDQHYAQRLIAWRYPRGHRVRGNALALLEQVSEYFGGVACSTIDASGNLYERSAAGAETVSHGESWTWDSEPASNWSRFWLLVDASTFATEHPSVGDAALWGGAFGVGSYAFGQLGFGPFDASAMRYLIDSDRPWKPAGTRAEWLVLSLDGSDATPDASWDHWSELVAGVQTATRSADHRFISLAPDDNNTYAGYPANYFTSTYMPSGATYAGSSASFPASITTYSGSVLAGDPNTYPESIRLIDDGDLVP